MNQRKTILYTGLIVVLVLIIYGMGVFYYRGHLSPQTYLGYYNVAHKTPQEASQAFDTNLETYEIDFSEQEENLGYIQLSQLEKQVDSKKVLDQALAEQNEWLWPINLFTENKIPIKEAVQFSEDSLDGIIYGMGIDNESRNQTENAKVALDENGLSLVPEKQGNNITAGSLGESLYQVMDADNHLIQLENAYEKPTIIQSEEFLNQQEQVFQNMADTQITLEFDGQSVTIPKEKITSWIFVNEDGELDVDREQISAYILELNKEYAGLFKPHILQSTYQGEVAVAPGTLGWYIDRFDEADVIAENILAGGSYTREPIIGGYGYGDNNYMTGSYVEVDLAHQMMFIYIDGQLVLETPIVSGIIGSSTIPGAYQVWQKLADTNLVGYNDISERNYSVPVSYWIAFDDQAQGIHDAEWQSSFGGDTYLQAGSLGCINTPPSVMGHVFELVYIGMPVLVF